MSFTPHVSGTSPIRTRNAATTALLKSHPEGTVIVAIEETNLNKSSSVSARMCVLRNTLERNGFSGVMVSTRMDRADGVIRGYVSISKKLSEVPTQKSAPIDNSPVVETVAKAVASSTRRIRRNGGAAYKAEASLNRVINDGGMVTTITGSTISGLDEASVQNVMSYVRKRQSALRRLARHEGYSISTKVRRTSVSITLSARYLGLASI